MARTQVQRRSETRRRLLDAAAAVFATRGVDGASVDAIADAADRTSGSVYAHFGSKDGLLVELLDEWKEQTEAVITADLIAAPTLDAQLGALWRNIAEPPTVDSRNWVALEHELWRWATKPGNEGARARLAERYAGVWKRGADAGRAWRGDGTIDGDLAPDAVAPLVVALMVGLEMQHRVAPGVITEEQAVAGLRAVLGATTSRNGSRKQRSRGSQTR